eukprot:Platyproteum_vivax@DN16920_c0_g1_i1.p1
MTATYTIGEDVTKELKDGVGNKRAVKPGLEKTNVCRTITVANSPEDKVVFEVSKRDETMAPVDDEAYDKIRESLLQYVGIIYRSGSLFETVQQKDIKAHFQTQNTKQKGSANWPDFFNLADSFSEEELKMLPRGVLATKKKKKKKKKKKVLCVV